MISMYEKKAVKIIVIIILAILMLCACNNTPATTETAESETVVDYQRETYIPTSTMTYTGIIIDEIAGDCYIRVSNAV